MGFSPIQNFRNEDFPELAKEGWSRRLFEKLNNLSRQVQNLMNGNVNVTQNLNGFWWEGTVGNYQNAEGIVFPFSDAVVPTVTGRLASAIPAFPFSFRNLLAPKKVNGVFVAQALDVTDGTVRSLPALLGGVAWAQESNGGMESVKIYAINGMVPTRTYFVKLLVLGE